MKGLPTSNSLSKRSLLKSKFQASPAIVHCHETQKFRVSSNIKGRKRHTAAEGKSMGLLEI